MENVSALQKLRLQYQTKLPKILHNIRAMSVSYSDKTGALADEEILEGMFPNTYGHPIAYFEDGRQEFSRPLRIGVVFSGGQASGGHNVICGLFDSMQQCHPDSILIGFLGGPSGVISNRSKVITKELVDGYRNQGGFDLIGSDRTKIEDQDQL